MSRTLIVFLLLCTATAAAADTPQEEADREYDMGRSSYTLHQWDKAIVRFKAAYRLDPKPVYLYRVAETYERKGKCDLSRAYYKAYARTAGDSRTERLTTCADDSVPALAHDSDMRDGGGRSHTLRTAGIGVGIVGVLATWGGVAASMNAAEDARTIKMLRNAGYPPDSPGIQYYTADRETAVKAARIGFAVGGAALVTAGAMFLWDWHQGRESRRISVAPTAGGASVTAAIDF